MIKMKIKDLKIGENFQLSAENPDIYKKLTDKDENTCVAARDYTLNLNNKEIFAAQALSIPKDFEVILADDTPEDAAQDLPVGAIPLGLLANGVIFKRNNQEYKKLGGERIVLGFPFIKTERISDGEIVWTPTKISVEAVRGPEISREEQPTAPTGLTTIENLEEGARFLYKNDLWKITEKYNHGARITTVNAKPIKSILVPKAYKVLAVPQDSPFQDFAPVENCREDAAQDPTPQSTISLQYSLSRADIYDYVELLPNGVFWELADIDEENELAVLERYNDHGHRITQKLPLNTRIHDILLWLVERDKDNNYIYESLKTGKKYIEIEEKGLYAAQESLETKPQTIADANIGDLVLVEGDPRKHELVAKDKNSAVLLFSEEIDKDQYYKHHYERKTYPLFTPITITEKRATND